MTKTLIYSTEYEALMQQNWETRHNPAMRRKYGVWRWRGMYEYRDAIVPLLSGTIIDFGGAKGPLGFDSLICDTARRPINGHHITYRDPNKIKPNSVDVIFSSHTLEHLTDLYQTISCFTLLLKSRGYLILNLPSIHNAEHWHPKNRDEHHCIFCLGMCPENDPNCVSADGIIRGVRMDVLTAEYTGDASIVIIGRKG